MIKAHIAIKTGGEIRDTHLANWKMIYKKYNTF